MGDDNDGAACEVDCGVDEEKIKESQERPRRLGLGLMRLIE